MNMSPDLKWLTDAMDKKEGGSNLVSEPLSTSGKALSVGKTLSGPLSAGKALSVGGALSTSGIKYKKEKSRRRCPHGTRRNATTKRCEKKKGLLSMPDSIYFDNRKSCPQGYRRNLRTNKCQNKIARRARPDVLEYDNAHRCPQGYRRNKKTKNCDKK